MKTSLPCRYEPVRWTSALVALAASLAVGIPAFAESSPFPPLNSPASTEVTPGRFVWADLFTSDPAAAAQFYNGLLGWTSTPVEKDDRPYLIMSENGRPVAGIVSRRSSAEKRPGVWIGYISVSDTGPALSKIGPAGGMVRAPAREFPDRGTQAIVTDSEGSVVGILHSSSGDPADVEPKPGEWNWFELYSLKAKATAEFYHQIVGYSVSDDSITGKPGHILLSSGGHARAGIAPLPASPDSRSGWLGFLRVDDLDAAAAKATRLGGTVLDGPRASALGSRVAIIADPTGASVGLVQYMDNANPGNKP